MIITLSFIALYFIIVFKTNDEKLPIISKLIVFSIANDVSKPFNINLY